PGLMAWRGVMTLGRTGGQRGRGTVSSVAVGGDGSSVRKRWGGGGRSGRSCLVGVAHCEVPPGAWAGLMRPAFAAPFGLGPVKLRGSAQEQEQLWRTPLKCTSGSDRGHGSR